MTTTSRIDFERAAILMDVVAKVAHVGPAYLALSGAAMNELKEMNDVALAEQKALGEERLKNEQAATTLSIMPREPMREAPKTSVDSTLANRRV